MKRKRQPTYLHKLPKDLVGYFTDVTKLNLPRYTFDLERDYAESEDGYFIELIIEEQNSKLKIRYKVAIEIHSPDEGPSYATLYYGREHDNSFDIIYEFLSKKEFEEFIEDIRSNKECFYIGDFQYGPIDDDGTKKLYIEGGGIDISIPITYDLADAFQKFREELATCISDIFEFEERLSTK